MTILPNIILIIVLVISLTGIYVHYLKNSEAVTKSRICLENVEYVIRSNQGKLPTSLLSNCDLGINAQMEVEDLETGQKCISETRNYSVSISLPVLISYGKTTHMGMVTCRI